MNNTESKQENSSQASPGDPEEKYHSSHRPYSAEALEQQTEFDALIAEFDKVVHSLEQLQDLASKKDQKDLEGEISEAIKAARASEKRLLWLKDILWPD